MAIRLTKNTTFTLMKRRCPSTKSSCRLSRAMAKTGAGRKRCARKRRPQVPIDRRAWPEDSQKCNYYLNEEGASTRVQTAWSSHFALYSIDPRCWNLFPLLLIQDPCCTNTTPTTPSMDALRHGGTNKQNFNIWHKICHYEVYFRLE